MNISGETKVNQRHSWSVLKPRLEARLPMSRENSHMLQSTFLFKVEDAKRQSVKMLTAYLESDKKTTDSSRLSPKSFQKCDPLFSREDIKNEKVRSIIEKLDKYV
jgi:hypothetical protein